MELYARRVSREKAMARRRSLERRLGGSLIWKYLQVVPSVFTARGGFRVLRLLVPREKMLVRIRDSSVLTLDSASELLGGFRFGRGGHVYAYFNSSADLEVLVEQKTGEHVADDRMPLLLSPPDQEFLFAVVCETLPPHREHAGRRIVTREHLIRDFLGFYGLRRDLLVEIENKLGGIE
jgi:hypothetical protein